MRLDAAEAKIAELGAEVKRLQALIGSLQRWTTQYGKDLCPPGVNTYGEGVRDSKNRVKHLLRGA